MQIGAQDEGAKAGDDAWPFQQPVLQFVAALRTIPRETHSLCCSVLQCVALCCSVLNLKGASVLQVCCMCVACMIFQGAA